jgi:RNA recognition motif-containing protein
VFGRVIAINIIPKSDYAFAFVEYDDMRDAVDAQKGLDKSIFRGRKLKVEFKNTKPVYTKATLESE